MGKEVSYMSTQTNKGAEASTALLGFLFNTEAHEVTMLSC